MSELKRRLSRFETRADTAVERFVFHHKLLGSLMIFIGMPLAMLAAVCACTILAAVPFALLFGAV